MTDRRQRYGAILADPPWRFRTYSAKGKGRAPERHYSTMSFGRLKRLRINGVLVRDLAARDCALFLWATGPMLPKALELLTAWGFVYKAVAFAWIKPNRKSDGFAVGLGYWTRANAEFVLLATRGNPKRLAKDVRQLIVSPRREHSRKPGATRKRIERLVDGPYLELFSRSSRRGWDTWGDEAGKFDKPTLKGK